jgi:hypothetical protein
MRDAENRLLSPARSEALLSGSTTISVPMIGHFEIDVIGDPGQDATTELSLLDNLQWMRSA